MTNFFPTVVKTLGFSDVKSLLLTAPPYLLAVITAFLNALHSGHTRERYFHVTVPLYVAIAAFILAATTTATAPRYVAMMLMLPGIYTGYVVALGWISNCMPRPPAKRAAALAAINAVSNTSSIYASYMFPKSDGPRYGKISVKSSLNSPINATSTNVASRLVLAMSVCSATAFIALVMATVLRFILVRLNKKLDRGEHVEGAINAGAAVPGLAAQRGFRFLV